MLRKITLFVISLHLSLILALTFSPSCKEIKTRPHLLVRTEKLQPAQKKEIRELASSPSNRKPSPPQPPPPPQSKPVKPGPPKKPSKAAKKPAEKKGPPEKKQKQPTQKTPAKKVKEPAKKPEKKQNLFSEEEMKQMEEALTLIEGKQKNPPALSPSFPSQSLKEPLSEKPSKELGLEQDWEITSSYEEALVSHLHTMLNLPEYGDVSIELTLLPDGSVTKVVVLKAESVKNRKYLEAHLPLLRFPPLEDRSVKEKTFKLIFSNEL